MFTVLDELIECIQKEYDKAHEKWKQGERYLDVNLKRKNVDDIDNGLLTYLVSYRTFMVTEQINVLRAVSYLQSDKSKITARTKQQNSIVYKRDKYLTGPLKGKMPINKCFNDLFGMRIILNCDLKHREMIEHIKNRFHNLKVINSTKGEYKAVHIYFSQGNSSFPWELQIWSAADEDTNLRSHSEYKQEYTAWEREYKNT